MSKIYDGGYVPVNRAAAMAIGDQKTDKITLPERFYREHWHTPPKMRDVQEEQAKKPDFQDLTGFKLGRRTVVGLSSKQAGEGSAYWVVRCVCGVYELQRGRALRTGRAPDMCCWCNYNEFLRHDGSKKLVQSFDGGPWKECPLIDRHAATEAKIDYSGVRFGTLTIIGLPVDRSKGYRTWITRCDCGLHERRNVNGLIKKYKKGEVVTCATCAYKSERP